MEWKHKEWKLDNGQSNCKNLNILTTSMQELCPKVYYYKSFFKSIKAKQSLPFFGLLYYFLQTQH